MSAPRFLLLLPTVLIIYVSVMGQPFYFRHYQVESGLSNNAVMCSVQDKLGFMWFGTRDGLNRFDGYTFKVYRFSNNNNKSSGNNFIHALHINKSGSLLVATEKEIYRYDAKTDSFTFLVSAANYAIDRVISDGGGNIWFNAQSVLYRYNDGLKQLTTYDPKNFFFATGLSIDEDDNVWIATSNGFLKKYNAGSNTFTSFDLFAESDKNRPRNINIIQCIKTEKILVGTNKAGFKIFEAKTNTYKDIDLCCEKLNNLFIRSFLPISDMEICIGTETGIYIYNTQNGESKKIHKNSTDQYTISDNVVYTLCKDSEGGLWVGTYFGGINYYPRQFTPFEKFYHKPFENSLSGNIVREVTQDYTGNIWIGTEDGGLNKLDSKTGKFVHFKPDNNPQSISYIGVHDLLSYNDELWVGTYEHGLDIFNIKTGRVVRHYEATSNKGLNSNFPFCLFKTVEGEILAGTTNGLYTYKPKQDYFESTPGFPSNQWYMCVLKDAGGTIWAGNPGAGVYYFNTNTGQSGSYKYTPLDPTSLASDKVNSIFEDKKKNLWFATENGLCQWDPVNRSFKRFGTSDGFPSNFILTVLEDEKGNLWISTTQGLACFNPTTQKTQVYTTSNGLLSDQFNFSSAYKDRDGRMYFGSAKGLIRFHPSDFRMDSFVPPVYFTSLQINNQEIEIAPVGSPLKQSLVYADKIVLRDNQSTFSLDFAALGYTAPQNLEYAYTLEGLSNNWTYVKRNRKVYFTKLPAGTYVFRVKASSSSGIWSNDETKLFIEILPPWWASKPAYTVYTILSLLFVYVLFHYYHQWIEEKNRRKIQLLEIAKEKEIIQVEIAKEKEMLESKIEFFTNVAHEIKTPLTLIKVPLATVIAKTAGTPIVDNCLKIMERNTNRLIELSNQLLDFRQTELKKYSLSLDKVNISEFLYETSLNFTTLAEQKNVDLKMTLPDTSLFAYVDADAFSKIIYNLIGNAVKYAASKVEVLLLPQHYDDDSFTILIKNDGFIIPSDLKEKIFEPFYRIKETEIKGTGIGLALARSLTQTHNGELLLKQPEDNMNIFSLTLPIHANVNNINNETNHSFS